MRLVPLRLKRQFAHFCLLICTLIGVQTQAIINIPPLPAETTPLLIKSLKEGHKAYYERYKDEININDPLSQHFWIAVDTDIELTFKEIILAQLNSYKREAYAEKMLNEFQSLQAEILSRGYKPSEAIYWAPAQRLSLIWNGEHFDFQLDLNYQPVDEPLQGGDQYPRVSLKGWLFFKCADPIESAKRFDNCVVQTATLNSAGIEWHTIPSHRGGNSSAGGGSGTNKSDVMSKPLIIKNLQMAQSLGLLQKLNPQSGLGGSKGVSRMNGVNGPSRKPQLKK